MARNMSRAGFLRSAVAGAGALAMAASPLGAMVRKSGSGVWVPRKYADMSPEYAEQIYEQGLAKILTNGEEAILNPFLQPNQADKNWQGSGDSDRDNDIDYDDITAMQAGADNYASDVDGDGNPSQANDQSILQSYLDSGVPYLPGAWDYLQTGEERLAWLGKGLEIDQTDKLLWHDGTVDDRWISGNFAAQIYLNFFGYSGTGIPTKYDTSQIGRYNMPVYWTLIYPLDGGLGHGMNFILIGDNPLDFNSWCPIEPQKDSINFKPGETQSIPLNSGALIVGTTVFPSDMPSGIPLLDFQIDENGVVSRYYKNDNLILERPEPPEPPVGISRRNTLPDSYSLEQNYPNPFNLSTTIEYNLPIREHIKIDIYDIRGKTVKTLVDEVQGPGEYRTGWDGRSKEGNNVPSGVYLYQLKAGDYVGVGRMVYLK